jgi:carbamoyl-phosphate synthase large subunit
VLLDHFLNSAVELDVDAICDGKNVIIGGIMEHIEQAGVHSGDSACSLPPYTLSEDMLDKVREQIRAMALELGVVGLMNTQFAVQDNELYIIEVNPRASRTVPFVSKATGRPLAKIAARCMVNESLSEQGVDGEIVPKYYSVKEAVFPFIKFPGVDPILGPEMKSTGEVMGVGRSFGEAFAKATLGAGTELPTSGRAFISVREVDKHGAVEIGKELDKLGFKLIATGGTAKVLADAGLECEHVNKVTEGRPHIVDMIKNDQIDLIVNTTEGRQAIADSATIRREALQHKVAYTTTLAGGRAVCMAIGYECQGEVNRLQTLHEELQA